MANETRIEHIKKYGMNNSVRDNLIKFLSGGKITANQAIKCKCYDCCGYYADGRKDCGVKTCSLYPWMPYNKNKGKISIPMSDERKKQSSDNLKMARFTRRGAKPQ
jgi:hypothetical protein